MTKKPTVQRLVQCFDFLREYIFIVIAEIYQFGKETDLPYMQGSTTVKK